MIWLITGGSGSGKSEYAENLAVTLGEKRAYIATMYPWDEECRQRIKKHRLMREKKNFQTIECFLHLKDLVLTDVDTALLECMSNLTSNEMYMAGGAGADTIEAVMAGIAAVKDQVEHFIIVTNEVFSDGMVLEEEMCRYLKNLGEINQRIGKMAGGVTEVVYSIPIFKEI